MNTLDRNQILSENYGLLRWAAARACRKARGLNFDDALAEVSLLACRMFHRYDPGRGKLSTWLGCIARTVAYRFQQDRRCQCRDIARERDGLDFDLLAIVAADPPNDLTPELAAFLPKVLAAVAELPADLRTAITLRYGLDGGGYRTLDQIDPTVTREANRARVIRGLKLLRAALVPPEVETALPRDTVAADSQQLLAVLRWYRCPLTARTLARLTGLHGTPFRRAIILLREAGVIRRRGRGYKLVRRKAVAA